MIKISPALMMPKCLASWARCMLKQAQASTMKGATTCGVSLAREILNTRPIATKYLQSGDQISLFCTEKEGYLGSVSFTESDIAVFDGMEMSDFCKDSVFYIIKESEREHEQTAAGEVIRYGSSVILKHRGTRKCVAASAHLASTYESDARKVELMHYEDVLDLQAFEFIVLPRYKLRLEGEPIRYGDHVVFMSKLHGVRNRMFLRASNSLVERDLIHFWGAGVGCDSTGFRVDKYRSCSPDSHEYLMGGDHVRLFHKELEGFLSVTGKYFDGFSCVPVNQSTSFTSLSIWEFEHGGCTVGAPLTWRTPCRMKHLSAGNRYLALKSGVGSSPDSNFKSNSNSKSNSSGGSFNAATSEVVELTLALTKQFQDRDALFTLHPVDEPGAGNGGGGMARGLVRRDCPFRIQHCSSGRWLHAQLQTESESEVAVRRLHEARLQSFGRKSALVSRKTRSLLAAGRSQQEGAAAAETRLRGGVEGRTRRAQEGHRQESVGTPLSMVWGTAEGLAAVMGNQRGLLLPEQLMSLAVSTAYLCMLFVPVCEHKL
jgi:hypothetical protein